MEAEGCTYCPWVRLTTKQTTRGTSSEIPNLNSWSTDIWGAHSHLMCTKLSTRDSAPALTWKKAGSLKKGAESPDPEGAGLKVWSHLLNYSYQSIAGWRQADTQAGLWEAGENTNREVVWLTLFHASLDIWGCVDYNTCSVFPVILSLSPFELNKLSATMLQTLQLQL